MPISIVAHFLIERSNVPDVIETLEVGAAKVVDIGLDFWALGILMLEHFAPRFMKEYEVEALVEQVSFSVPGCSCAPMPPDSSHAFVTNRPKSWTSNIRRLHVYNTSISLDDCSLVYMTLALTRQNYQQKRHLATNS
jgi:hypothetical protein